MRAAAGMGRAATESDPDRYEHHYAHCDVLVIGGKNSAAEASLDLWRHGAQVTLVHRHAGLHDNIKYWVRPDIENRIKSGEIPAYFDSTVTEIGNDYVLINTPDGPVELKNDFVFAMTGYHPDFDFLTSVGIELSTEQCRPVLMAISSADRRRQREVDAARHLLECDVCARLSEPLIGRGRAREDEVRVLVRTDTYHR